MQARFSSSSIKSEKKVETRNVEMFAERAKKKAKKSREIQECLRKGEEATSEH